MDERDIKAWEQLSKEEQEALLEDGFCLSCGKTTIIDFTVNCTEEGLLIKGKCIGCSDPIIRMIQEGQSPLCHTDD